MNRSLTSLVADVYTLTNRPDLVGETTLAVKNATLKAHQSDYFYKDLFETGVVFDFALTQQALEYKQLIPRWRSLKYIRPYAVSGDTGAPKDFLHILTPEDLLDSYGRHKENVCYVAGLQLQIRTSIAQTHFLLGCYVNPDVTDERFNSWVADESPAAIVYAAAATVFKTIGYDEQVSTYNALVADEYRALKSSNIIANGY